jgi:hypothetical protein
MQLADTLADALDEHSLVHLLQIHTFPDPRDSYLSTVNHCPHNTGQQTNLYSRRLSSLPTTK